ncbi:hypothetical protein K438DRAFT_1800995 [Mycena galopus ATCC 62051]|nr:hypothetical protein K438DRAFT_1800995 [Mycena galopus ATCC 62051]
MLSLSLSLWPSLSISSCSGPFLFFLLFCFLGGGGRISRPLDISPITRRDRTVHWVSAPVWSGPDWRHLMGPGPEGGGKAGGWLDSLRRVPLPGLAGYRIPHAWKVPWSGAGVDVSLAVTDKGAYIYMSCAGACVLTRFTPTPL